MIVKAVQCGQGCKIFNPRQVTDLFSVHIKAGNITGDDVEITVTKAGTQLIDGDAAIYLESPFAAVSLVYVASDVWRIV